jgi:hypothetical protein
VSGIGRDPRGAITRRGFLAGTGRAAAAGIIGGAFVANGFTAMAAADTADGVLSAHELATAQALIATATTATGAAGGAALDRFVAQQQARVGSAAQVVHLTLTELDTAAPGGDFAGASVTQRRATLAALAAAGGAPSAPALSLDAHRSARASSTPGCDPEADAGCPLRPAARPAAAPPDPPQPSADGYRNLMGTTATGLAEAATSAVGDDLLAEIQEA